MKAVLYLGLDPARYKTAKKIIHHPIISIVPKSLNECRNSFKHVEQASHIILTSQNSVSLFLDHSQALGYRIEELEKKHYISVGKVTTQKILDRIGCTITTAQRECQEGVIDLLRQLHPRPQSIFFPHSYNARPLLKRYLQENFFHHVSYAVYQTVTVKGVTLPWGEFDEIVFTSPSTVDAFIHNYGPLPLDIKLTSIGEITQNYLQSVLSSAAT